MERSRSNRRLFTEAYREGSKATFGKIDHEIWKMTWQWAKRRHPKKMLKWIKSKYFQSMGTRRWVFREKDNPMSLLKLSDIPIRRHIKIKANANPYDREWHDYFIKRSQRILPGTSLRLINA